MGLEINGQRIDTSVFGAADRLWQENMQPVGIMVLFTTAIVPLVELATVIWLVLPLRLGKRPPAFARLFRLLQLAHPWGMVEVFILGVLATFVRN